MPRALFVSARGFLPLCPTRKWYFRHIFGQFKIRVQGFHPGFTQR